MIITKYFWVCQEEAIEYLVEGAIGSVYFWSACKMTYVRVA